MIEKPDFSKSKKSSKKIKELPRESAEEILSLMHSDEDKDEVMSMLMDASGEYAPKKQFRLRFESGDFLLTTIIDLINEGVPSRNINRTAGIVNGFPAIPPSNDRLHIVKNTEDKNLETVVSILDNVEGNSLRRQGLDPTPDNRTKLALLNSGLEKTSLNTETRVHESNPDVDEIINQLNPDQIFESTIYLAGNASKWQIRLDEMGDIDNLSSAEMEEMKEYKTRICGYNKLVKEFINQLGSRQEFTFSEVLNTMRTKAVAQYPELGPVESRKSLEEIINGMRYELLFEIQIIEDGEYMIKNAPVELDLVGIDYILTNNAGEEILVDVKASIRGVHGRHPSRVPYQWVKRRGKDVLVIWPQLEYGDFEGKLNPPIDTKSMEVMNTIKRALAA